MKPSYLKYLIFYEKNILNLTWLILVKNLNVRRKNSLILKLKLVVRLLRILKPKPMSFIKVVAINQNSLNAKKKNRKKRKKNVVETTLRSEEHTSELQSRFDIVCRLLLVKKLYSIVYANPTTHASFRW